MEILSALIQNPLGLVAYVFVILTFISLWIRRHIWIWLPLFAISFVFAYFGKIVDSLTLVPIAILCICHALLSQDIKNFWRFFASLVAAILSLALMTHFIRGFYNIPMLSNWSSGPEALPINFSLPYDTPLIAIFVAGFYLPLMTSKERLVKMLVPTIPWTVMTFVIVFGLMYYLQAIHYAPKLPSITLLWLIIELFFVVVPEEIFFRGFLQREVTRDLNNSASGILAILIISLLSAAVHLLSIPSFSFFVTIFVANVLYGGIYLITGLIESSIFLHYVTNLAHFFFFTYPMLQTT